MGLGGMVALDGREQKVGRRGCEGEQVAIGDGVLWATPCKRKAKPEAQLGDRQSESVEPRRDGCGKFPPNPSSIHQVESIQSVGSVGSVGSIASIHPKKGTFPIGIAFSAHHP